MSAWEPPRASGRLIVSRIVGWTFLGALLLWAVGLNPFVSKCRVRWTVTVMTPDGPRTGSGALEVWAYRQPRIGEASSTVSDVRGEAIAIPWRSDYVFAVLNSAQATWITRAITSDSADTDDRVDRVRRIRRMAGSGRSFDLPEREFPDLVRFPDRNDTESIRAVCLLEGDPSDRAPPRSCAVRPVRVTVTPTREQVTDRIVELLP